jgi:hypothetical protein
MVGLFVVHAVDFPTGLVKTKPGRGYKCAVFTLNSGEKHTDRTRY